MNLHTLLESFRFLLLAEGHCTASPGAQDLANELSSGVGEGDVSCEFALFSRSKSSMLGWVGFVMFELQLGMLLA